VKTLQARNVDIVLKESKGWHSSNMAKSKEEFFYVYPYVKA